MATVLVAMSVSGQTAGSDLAIVFDHYVGDRQMTLDTVTYLNGLDQQFTVTKFKYYIGNICLHRVSGSSVQLGDYHLISEEEPESKTVVLHNLPAGNYATIDFIVGVDSMQNCSGAQEGALDAANGMFWAWNTGYIFLKLEGKAPASKSPGNIFEYHIGGYKAPANCIRHISLKLKDLEIPASNKLHIKVDAAECMKTPTTIDLSKLSSVTDFHNAAVIADNYSDMFSADTQTVKK